MNKQFAQAWDEVAALAERREASLVRDGHRFFYQWHEPTTGPDSTGPDGTGPGAAVSVPVWAVEEMPRFGVRVGEVSARCWNLAAVEQVITGLTRIDIITADG